MGKHINLLLFLSLGTASINAKQLNLADWKALRSAMPKAGEDLSPEQMRAGRQSRRIAKIAALLTYRALGYTCVHGMKEIQGESVEIWIRIIPSGAFKGDTAREREENREKFLNAWDTKGEFLSELIDNSPINRRQHMTARKQAGEEVEVQGSEGDDMPAEEVKARFA